MKRCGWGCGKYIRQDAEWCQQHKEAISAMLYGCFLVQYFHALEKTPLGQLCTRIWDEE